MKDFMIKRSIILDGAHNVRDIGGYKVQDKYITKCKKFIRADGLENLTDNDIKKLLDYGLKIDIDLRSEQEYSIFKDKLEECKEVSYCSVELLKNLKITAKTLGGLYIDALESCKKEFYELFKIMIDNTDKTILFHCSAGKDRTGMTAAILLMIAGVSREDIISDYTETTENLKAIIDKYSFENDESLKNYLDSDAVNMEEFMDYITDKYGRAEEYLKSIGITDDDIKKLRDSFLEKI